MGIGEAVTFDEAGEAPGTPLNELEDDQSIESLGFAKNEVKSSDLHGRPRLNARVPKIEFHQPIFESFEKTAPSETVDDTIEQIVPSSPRQPRVVRNCRPENRYHSTSLQLSCTPISILNTPTPRLRRRRPINPIPSVEIPGEFLVWAVSFSVAIEDAPFSQTMTSLDETSRILTGSRCKQRGFPII